MEQKESFLSKCPKLKTGQLLMQRYHWCYYKGKDTKYDPQALKCKEKSIELARRMRAHADKCTRCSQDDPVFYGV